jgi:hypothetical protein
LNLVSSQVAPPRRTEPGLWLLELESRFGRRAAGMADAGLALSEDPLVDASARDAADRGRS